MSLDLERILSQNTLADNQAKSERNFVKIENEVDGFGEQINNLESQLSEPDYTPTLFRQEPIFSTGSGYVGTTPTDLSADIIQGQVPVSAKGLSVVSFIDNGNFVSMDGWINYLSTVAVLNNEVTFTATGAGGRISQGFKAELDNIYYMFCDVKADSSFVKFRMAGFTSISHSGSGLYEHLSSYAKATVEYSSVFLVEDTRTSGWTAVKVKNAVGINLTAMFGVGNEPTKEQCDYMFPRYFDGIGSVKGARIKSVGKNLYHGELVAGGFNAANGNLDTSATTWRSNLNYINVKPNTTYKASWIGTLNHIYVFYYDINKKYISYLDYGYSAFTTPTNAYYIRVCWSHSDQYDIQIEEGATATPYEEYKESVTYLPDLHSVPSAKDEINGSKHTIRVVPYELKASDMPNWDTSSSPEVDYIYIQKKSDDVMYGNKTFDKLTSLHVIGFTNGVFGLNPDSIGVVCNNPYSPNGDIFLLIVAKNTYTSLAVAQTALAGTKILYKLATPIVEDGITPLTVYPKGTITVESDEETVTPELYLSYPLDMSAVVARLNDGVNQNAKAVNLKANKEQEDWITATLQNGWTGMLQYRKNQIGQLEIKAELTVGTTAIPTLITILPVEYRPIVVTPVTVYNINGYVVRTPIAIHSTGTIYLRSNDGITTGNNIAFNLVVN